MSLPWEVLVFGQCQLNLRTVSYGVGVSVFMLRYELSSQSTCPVKTRPIEMADH